MSRVLKVLLPGCLAVVLAAGLSAQAQPPEGGRGGRPGGFMGGMMGGGMMGGATNLLRSEQVQKELKITEEQKTKLEALSAKLREQMRGSFGDFRNMSEEERAKLRADMEKRGEETRKELAAILQPEQLKRLKQIELQQQGTMALARPEVAEAIGLSEEQKQKLQEISTAAREAMGALFGRGQGDQGGDPAARREQFTKAREESEKKAMDVLTAEQKQKLRDMMGEPFELDRSQFQGRGDGQRGDRPRGNGDRPRNDP